MKRAVLLLISFILLFVPVFNVYASGSDSILLYPRGTVYRGLSDFLTRMNINFHDYIELMNALEETGEYPHYIEEYETRYERYKFNNPELPMSAVIAYVNINEDYAAYAKISVISDPYDISVLVNKNYQLPANWEPDDLVRIENSNYLLREEAAMAFSQMRDAIREEGMNLHIISAFRPYNTQDQMHSNGERWYGLERADLNWARAGHSEHQTGLSIDILHRSHSGGLQSANFQETEEYIWLLGNAYKYGYILRYPEEYIEVHKYMYEPWHWRYVGTDIATAMYNNNIYLYEMYYGKYLAPEVLTNVEIFILEATGRVAG